MFELPPPSNSSPIEKNRWVITHWSYSHHWSIHYPLPGPFGTSKHLELRESNRSALGKNLQPVGLPFRWSGHNQKVVPKLNFWNLKISVPGNLGDFELGFTIIFRWTSHFNLASWWLNQPIWKICSSKWESSPNRLENKKYLKPPPSWGVLHPASSLGNDSSNLQTLRNFRMKLLEASGFRPKNHAIS